jgi:hypothetical protein
MVLLLLMGIGLMGLTIVYFFRENFVAELMISFLPYWAGGLAVLSVVLLGVLIRRIWKRKKVG